MSWLPKGFEFLAGIPERLRKRIRLVPIQAYIDESGARGQGAAMVLASVSAPAEAWASFSDDWERWLQAKPSIAYFKLDDALSFKKEFYGWSEQARNEKLMRLASVIDRHQMRSVVVSIALRPYEELIVKNFGPTAGRDPFGQPYLFALVGLLIALGEDARDIGVDEPIQLFLDRNDQFKADAENVFSTVRPYFWPEIDRVLPRDLWFKDDKLFMPLQAADWFAGELRLMLDGKILRLPEPLRGRDYPSVTESPRSRCFDGKALVRSAQSIVNMIESIRDLTPYVSPID